MDSPATQPARVRLTVLSSCGTLDSSNIRPGAVNVKSCVHAVLSTRTWGSEPGEWTGQAEGRLNRKKWGLFEGKPPTIGVGRGRIDNARRRFLSPAQLQALLAEAQRRDPTPGIYPCRRAHRGAFRGRSQPARASWVTSPLPRRSKRMPRSGPGTLMQHVPVLAHAVLGRRHLLGKARFHGSEPVAVLDVGQDTPCRPLQR